jgi:hypothetical protein
MTSVLSVTDRNCSQQVTNLLFDEFSDLLEHVTTDAVLLTIIGDLDAIHVDGATGIIVRDLACG